MQIGCDTSFSLAKTIFVEYSFYSSSKIFLRFLETIESNETLLPQECFDYYIWN